MIISPVFFFFLLLCFGRPASRRAAHGGRCVFLTIMFTAVHAYSILLMPQSGVNGHDLQWSPSHWSSCVMESSRGGVTGPRNNGV